MKFAFTTGLLMAACLGGCAATVPREVVEEVPFALTRNQVVVVARLQGKGPYSCLVDTGANPSVIDLALARTLGLRLSAEAGAAQGVGKDDVAVYESRMQVEVQGTASSDIETVAMDMKSFSSALASPVHCVLGQSWLATRAIELDYPRLTMRFVTSGNARRDSRCREFAMVFWQADDLMPLVTVQVNGVDLPVTLDTGSSGTLKLFPLGAIQAGVEAKSSGTEVTTVTGARGKSELKGAEARSLRFGPLAFTEMKIALGEPNQDEPPGRYGNLGNGVFRHGMLALDYPARRIAVCLPTQS